MYFSVIFARALASDDKNKSSDLLANLEPAPSTEVYPPKFRDVSVAKQMKTIEIEVTLKTIKRNLPFLLDTPSLYSQSCRYLMLTWVENKKIIHELILPSKQPVLYLLFL